MAAFDGKKRGKEEKRKELSTSITIFHIWEGKGRESDSCLVLLEGGTVDKMCPRKEKGGETRFLSFGGEGGGGGGVARAGGR